jgi:hypothetical protein
VGECVEDIACGPFINHLVEHGRRVTECQPFG